MATRAMETFGGLIGLVFLSLMMMAKAQTCPGGVEEIPYNSGPKPKMLIGIGTPRSGSTLLFNKLAGHPQIIPSYSKATHFFDRPGLELSGDSFNEYLRNWGVQDLLEMLVEGNVLMEFTPSYLSNPMAPCHVRRMFPDAKFMVSVRDPTYSLLSHINEQRDKCLQGGSEYSNCCTDHTPLKPWLQRDFHNLNDHYEECFNAFAQDPWWRCPVNDKYDIYSTLYGPQIARWMMLFHPSQFIFINYEELVQGPEVQIQKLATFAGVSVAWRPAESTAVESTDFFQVFYVDTNFYETLLFLKQELQGPLEDFYRVLEGKGIFLHHVREEGFANKSFVSTQDSLSQCCQLHYCVPDAVLAALPLPLGDEAISSLKPGQYTTRKPGMLSRQTNEFFFLQLLLLFLGWSAALLLVVRRKHRRALRGCTLTSI